MGELTGNLKPPIASPGLRAARQRTFLPGATKSCKCATKSRNCMLASRSSGAGHSCSRRANCLPRESIAGK